MLARSRTAAVLAAWVLGALAGSAIADPKPPSEKDKQLASDLVKKAIAKSQAGDHGAAIDIYLQAYTIVPNSILLSNVGAEYQQSGKPQLALRYFCMYLEKEPNGTNAPYAASQARSLQIELGNKDVDERDVCAPAKPKTKPKTVPEDAPEPDPPIKPRRPKRDPEPGDERTSKVDTLRYGAIATGAGGLVALGIGAYGGIKASAISDEISSHDKTKPWPNDIQALQRRGQTYENVQIGSLIVGGALITTSVVLYVMSRSTAAEQSEKSVVVSPTANGIAVFGRF